VCRPSFLLDDFDFHRGTPQSQLVSHYCAGAVIEGNKADANRAFAPPPVVVAPGARLWNHYWPSDARLQLSHAANQARLKFSTVMFMPVLLPNEN